MHLPLPRKAAPLAIKIGLFAVAAILSPLVLAGLYMAYLGFQSEDQPLLAGGASSAFALVTLLILMRVFHAGRVALKNLELNARYKDQPWMVREDWAQGRVRSSTTRHSGFLWLFAIGWNGVVGLFIMLAVTVGDGQSRIPMLILMSVFGLIGLAILSGAVWVTLHGLRYGKATFQMQTIPGVVGGKLEGTLLAPLPAAEAKEVKLTLECVNRVWSSRYRHGRGRQDDMRLIELWKQEIAVPRGHLSPGPDGARFPVSFTIPYECPQTDLSNSRDTIEWTLRAHANVSGLDWVGTFEVPMFQTSRSSAEINQGGADLLRMHRQRERARG